MMRVIYTSSRARHFAIGTPKLMGLTRFELVTPRLSSVCSNQLSYRPDILFQRTVEPVLSKLDRRAIHPKP